jgi:hypothetical protein
MNPIFLANPCTFSKTQLICASRLLNHLVSRFVPISDTSRLIELTQKSPRNHLDTVKISKVYWNYRSGRSNCWECTIVIRTCTKVHVRVAAGRTKKQARNRTSNLLLELLQDFYGIRISDRQNHPVEYRYIDRYGHAYWK